MSYLKFFIKNGLGTTGFMLVLFVTSMIMSIYRDDTWELSFVFLGIAIIVPIGIYFSWKKKNFK